MQVEKLRPTTYRLTLSTYELATLIAAARWVTNGAEGELPPEARERISRLLEAYDAETVQLGDFKEKA